MKKSKNEKMNTSNSLDKQIAEVRTNLIKQKLDMATKKVKDTNIVSKAKRQLARLLTEKRLSELAK